MSSSSAAMAGTDLSSENERLRRENEQLSRELSEMKSLCNNILSLMWKYIIVKKTGIKLLPRPERNLHSKKATMREKLYIFIEAVAKFKMLEHDFSSNLIYFS